MSQIMRLRTIITAWGIDAFIACMLLLSHLAVDCMVNCQYLELPSVLPLPLLFHMTLQQYYEGLSGDTWNFLQFLFYST